MFAAFLGGWEAVLILSVGIVMMLGFAVAVGDIAWALWRQEKRAQNVSNPPTQATAR